jgi:energy-coupling factor transport system permease protein
LLASIPPALYEVGAAVVIALSLFPQLAESVQRVRRARRLRGDPGRGIGALRRVVVPVLEDALERSLLLAASMDARGYGRAGDLTPRQRWLTGGLLIGGLLGLCVGVYAFLDATAPRVLAVPMLLAGVAMAGAGFVAAGRRVRRTRYRPDRWRAADLLTAATGVGVAVLFAVAAAQSPAVVYPDPAVLPPLSALSLLAVLLGLVPAFATPPPALQSGPVGAPASHREPEPQAVAR